MAYGELAQRVIGIISKKPDFESNKETLLSEITMMENLNVLTDLFSIYQRVEDGQREPGSKNELNSLLSYFLGVSTKKPDGPFQLNKRRTYGRAGFPDIDMDFDYSRRHEIVTYLQTKYGIDRVGNIGTVLTLKAKAAVRKAVEVLDPDLSIDYSQKKPDKKRNFALQNEILETIPKNPAALKKPNGDPMKLVDLYKAFPDFARYMKQYPKVYEVAKRLEGSISSNGSHAAGIVISPIPLERICPLHITKGRSDNGEKKTLVKTVATQFSMEEVEALGLIKFDVLGLSTKTALALSTKLIKENHGVDIDLARLPLDDKPTLELLTNGDTDGCFQAEKVGMQHTFQQIGIDRFDDLIVAVAMYRPGPKDYIPELSDRKHGKRRVEYPHPSLKKITERSYGILCFQEQVMQAFMSLADLTASAGYRFMKGCAKKKSKLIAEYKELFSKSSIARGIDEKVVHKIWDDMEKFGGYAFNKTLHFSEGIITSKGQYTIEELFLMDANDRPQVYSPTGELIDIVDVYDHGIVPMYKVTFSDGSVHKCTGHHKFASDSGTLPLYEIIESNARVLINKEVSYASQQSLYLSGMRTYHQNSESFLGSQERMYRLEAKEVDSLSVVKSKELSKVLGQYFARGNGYLQEENVAKRFGINIKQRTRSTASIRINEASQFRVSGCLSTKQDRYLQKHLRPARDFIRTICASQEMERRQSGRILREVHQTSDGTANMAFGPRKGFKGNISPDGIQVLSNCDQPGIQHQIQTSSGGFSRPGQKDIGRVRWSTSLSRWIRTTPKKVFRERQDFEQSYVGSGISSDSNFVRCVGSSEKKIQIHRDGHSARCDNKQHEQTSRDVNWSYVSVVSVECIGLCQGYDLEVDSVDHLYCLSSGIVNSNSHATSYAYECWKTAYLKAHYMLEFMCARMSVEAQRRDFDFVLKCESDLRKHGYKILPPDINRSKMVYIKVDDKMLLRPLIIKGVGDKAAQDIVDHQPYKGKDLLHSFATKVGPAVNSKVFEALCDAKLFGTGKSKARLIKDFDTIKKDRKRGQGRQRGDIFA